MKFEEIVPHLREGKKVRKKSWVLPDYIYLYLTAPIIKNNYDDKCTLNGEDILSQDWELYEELEKTYTFQEAFEEFEKGKEIRREAWHKDSYLVVPYARKSVNIFSIEDIQATDWEIADWEEDK